MAKSTTWVNSPRCPGAYTPRAVSMVRVMADFSCNGTPDDLLARHKVIYQDVPLPHSPGLDLRLRTQTNWCCRRRAYRIMALLGLRRMRLYDARASCFTYLANMGVPDHLLARWAGHANVRTTKQWYVKPDVEDLRGAAAVWGGLHGSGDDIPRGRERL
jgi:hypothetical protein